MSRLPTTFVEAGLIRVSFDASYSTEATPQCKENDAVREARSIHVGSMAWIDFV